MGTPLSAVAQIRRATLRSDTQDALRSRIVDGRLPPGDNVVERDLSRELGISRTPLREALIGLEAGGLLRAEPQRGFFVLELSVEEAREIYSLIAMLEAFAVEQGRPAVSESLSEINRRFRAAAGRAQAVQYDREWHEELIQHCGLPRTAAILHDLRTAAARYEFRFFSGARVIAESARQHNRILRALHAKDYAAAATFVKQNWEQGLKWVESNFHR
jgi:DNA-binding GntR family transcriptional regulator